MHAQQGAWAVLSQSVFSSLSVSGSLCLTFKPCLLTSLIKTGLYFSFLECAGLVQVVERSKLSSFHNINTLLANNNYSTLGVFPLICWCMWGWWWCWWWDMLPLDVSWIFFKCYVLNFEIRKRILCICLQICWQLPLQHLAWVWHTPCSLIFFHSDCMPRFNSQRDCSSPPAN